MVHGAKTDIKEVNAQSFSCDAKSLGSCLAFLFFLSHSRLTLELAQQTTHRC